MGLDQELMKNEFMRRFGDYSSSIRSNLFELAIASKKTEYIPDSDRVSCEERVSDEPITKGKIEIYLKSVIGYYQELSKVIDETEQESQEHSSCFKLTKLFIEFLRQPIDYLEEYMQSYESKSSFRDSFSPYLIHLRTAIMCTNGIEHIRDIYDDVTSAKDVRIKWAEKHPDRDW